MYAVAARISAGASSGRMAPMRPRCGLLLPAVALGLLGCGGGSSDGAAGGGCGASRREAAAPDSSVHVVAGAEATYQSEPPTSGPHSPAPGAVVFDRSLTGPEQVGILETGAVLVQYRPDELDPPDRQVLVELARPEVRIAPNPALPSPVVLTAWTAKQQCDAVDAATIAEFVDEYGDELSGDR